VSFLIHFDDSRPNVVVQRLTLLLSIVRTSRLQISARRQASLSCGFPQSLQANSGTMPWSYTSIASLQFTYHLAHFQPTQWSEVTEKASLYKLQTSIKDSHTILFGKQKTRVFKRPRNRWKHIIKIDCSGRGRWCTLDSNGWRRTGDGGGSTSQFSFVSHA
jgi:hypothetical protein